MQLDNLTGSNIYSLRQKWQTHLDIYDSCNVELAGKTINSVILSYFTEVYSVSNEKNVI